MTACFFARGVRNAAYKAYAAGAAYNEQKVSREVAWEHCCSC